MTYALCSNAITLTSNQKFSERLAGCKQKTKRGAQRPPERLIMDKFKRQMNCLKNEIDHITEESIKHNNSPMTIHGQFQNIVKKIDQIVNEKTVYAAPNYWDNPN